MAETTPNPFENTNSGPTAPAPDAPVANAACCTVMKNACMASRVLWYAPVAMLFAGIVAVWAVPGLANFASPILNLIDPNFGAAQGAGCCSSTMKETGSCCSSLSKGAMLTSSVSSDEISLESEVAADDGLPACCSGGEGLCPLSQATDSDKVSNKTSDSEASVEEAGE